MKVEVGVEVRECVKRTQLRKRITDREVVGGRG